MSVRINGRQYEWGDITLRLGNRDMTGIRGIKYTTKKEKEHLHAKGRYAVAIQSGNITCEGEITLLQSDVISLQKSVRSGELTDLNLDALVSYGDPTEGDAIRTDSLWGIQFTEDNIEWKQGDKFAEVTLPFLCLRIKRGI